jgi:hypothetical protein
MNAARAISGAVFAILLALCGTLPVATARAQQAAPPSAAAEARQILVMLRLAPSHVRPNSSYGGD